MNILFTFEDRGQIRFSEEEVKYCSSNKELDATAIELTNAGVKRLMQFGAKFIRVTSFRESDKYVMIQFSFVKGNPIRLLAIAVLH